MRHRSLATKQSSRVGVFKLKIISRINCIWPAAGEAGAEVTGLWSYFAMILQTLSHHLLLAQLRATKDIYLTYSSYSIYNDKLVCFRVIKQLEYLIINAFSSIFYQWKVKRVRIGTSRLTNMYVS